MSSLELKVLTEADLNELGFYTRKTRYRKRCNGTFPQPINTDEGPNLYKTEDIFEWRRDPKAWAQEHSR